MKTRTDYLDKKCTHAEYYGQFVSPAELDMQAAARSIHAMAFRCATDPAFLRSGKAVLS